MKADPKWYKSLINQNNNFQETQSNILLKNNKYTYEKELIDYKSKLNNQTVTQKKTLEYRILKINGPDHKKEFTIAVFINNLKVAAAKAFSIKEAEQLAARKSLNIVS